MQIDPDVAKLFGAYVEIFDGPKLGYLAEMQYGNSLDLGRCALGPNMKIDPRTATSN